jgi:hypothetical protein
MKGTSMRNATRVIASILGVLNIGAGVYLFSHGDGGWLVKTLVVISGVSSLLHAVGLGYVVKTSPALRAIQATAPAQFYRPFFPLAVIAAAFAASIYFLV